MLAGIVFIRTFLNMALQLELEGRWPWQANVTEKNISSDPIHRNKSTTIFRFSCLGWFFNGYRTGANVWVGGCEKKEAATKGSGGRERFPPAIRAVVHANDAQAGRG